MTSIGAIKAARAVIHALQQATTGYPEERIAEIIDRETAAPELLAALDNLLDTTELNSDDTEPKTFQAIEQAEAAIAKAVRP